MKQKLINAKKAINYFEFKTRFAKNKSFHTKNVTYLNDLIKLLEKPSSNQLIINALLLELYLHKLLEIKNEHFALKEITSITDNPREAIANVQEVIKANIIFKRVNHPEFKTYQILEALEVKGIENHTQEILNILNNNIQWKM